MKFIFTAVAVLSLVFQTTAAQAAVHETKLKKELLEVEKLAEDSMGNGWSSVTELEQKPYNQKQQIAILNREVKGHGDCKMKTVVGRRANFKALYSDDVLYERKVPDRLFKMYKEKKIKAILSRQWDGKSGEGVYCGIYHFRIFSTDGHVLTFQIENTD